MGVSTSMGLAGWQRGAMFLLLFKQNNSPAYFGLPWLFCPLCFSFFFVFFPCCLALVAESWLIFCASCCIAGKQLLWLSTGSYLCCGKKLSLVDHVSCLSAASKKQTNNCVSVSVCV